MSVNRRFGFDAERPGPGVGRLNVVASQGAGSTYKVFVAAAALRAGHPAVEHDHDQRSVRLPRLQEAGGTVGAPYVVQNAGRYPPTLTMVEALVRSSNTYFVALEDQLGSVEGPVRMAQRMGLFSLDPVADQVIADRRGSFTLGAEATSPLALASAYSTLARQRHAVRPHAGHRRPRPRRRSRSTGADGGPLDTGDALHARGGAAGGRDDAQPDPDRRRRAPRSAPARAPPSRATRSPARRAPARTGSRSPSSATPRSTPRASWCSTPSTTRTSAPTAAGAPRRSGTTRWCRSSSGAAATCPSRRPVCPLQDPHPPPPPRPRPPPVGRRAGAGRRAAAEPTAAAGHAGGRAGRGRPGRRAGHPIPDPNSPIGN